MALLAIGVTVVGASWAVQPGPGDQWSYFMGEQMGGPCDFREASGHPCPTCGMTRSWVRASRGQLLEAARFHAAGTLLFLGLVTTGVVGAIRLIRGDPKAVPIPSKWLMVAVLGWVAAHMLQWGVRLLGGFPLP